MQEPFKKTSFRSKRGFKIADHIRKTVSEIVRAKVKDPRVKTITIIDVEITYDISIAKIYYSVFPWSKDNIDNAHAGLESARKYIRMQLGKELTCHRIPDIIFKLDISLDRGGRINELLSRIAESQQD